MFHTKFHQNRIINEYFEILGGEGGGKERSPYLENSEFIYQLQLKFI